jgi:hypothetical protein
MTDVSAEAARKSTLEFALVYNKANPSRYLFPIKPLAKFPPMVKDNLDGNASNDPEQLKKWHAKWPGCNWGIALRKSNLLVVDVDSKAGKVGQLTYDLLDLDYAFPETETVRTPSGGTHRYYSGRHVFALGKNGFGPDVDSPNYVLIAGCTFKDGTSYRMVPSPSTKPAPQWFYEVLGAAKEKIENAGEAVVDLDKHSMIAWAKDYLQNDAEPAIQGEGGENATWHVAVALRDMGISEPMAVELMLEHYNDRCEPAWEVEDLTKKVANGYRYASLSKIGGKTAEADFIDDDAEVDSITPFGDPAKIAKQVQAAADRAQSRAEGSEQPKPKERPQVNVLPSLLHEAMDATQEILLKQSRKSLNRNGGSTIADQIFQRDGHLVRLNRNLHLKKKAKGDPVAVETKTVDGVTVDSQYQEKNALTILEVRPPWLTTRLGRTIQYMGPSAGKPGKKPSLKPKDVPLPLVNQLIGDETQWKFPALFSTIEAPTLRADGSILDEPGYDRASGIFFDPGDTLFPRINPEPSAAQGIAAIKYVDDEILDCFPFVDQEGYEGVSRSVALSMMLTGPVRRGLKIAPAFAADSNEPESGKSMLLKAAGALMTGREIAGRPFSDSEEERRKTLGTAFFEARPVLFFDNVDCVIEGASLEMALTTPIFEDRKLGSHEGISAPTNSLALFSANHVQVGGDGMTTRVLVSRIVPTKTLARRLTDGDFKHPFLIDYIIENRPKLIAAVLTALRAFILHGQRDMPPTISRFPEWGSLIGNALIWYGYADPTRGGDAIRAADPVKEAMRDVVRAWSRNFRRKAVTAADLVSCPAVRETIGSAINERERDVSAHMASIYVKKMTGVGLDQAYMVASVPELPGRRRAARWHLVQTTPDELLPDPTA